MEYTNQSIYKEDNNFEKVNIEEVFKSKNPGLAKIMPRFVFRYLKKIIHEDFINDFMERHGSKYGIDFVHAAIEEYKVNIEIKSEENIPQKGRFIFVANHPLGGFDGIIFMHLLDKMGFQFKVLVNDILMNIKNLGPLFIPINKHGGHTREAIKRIEDTFNSDLQLLTFPSGFVSRRIKGVITDLTWQKNFIVKAVKHEREIIPVHFSGRNSSFFYNLYAIRTFLGIKANMEMFYLMNETQKHRNKTITVTFGKPIPYNLFDSKLKPIEWAAKVKELVYKLPENPEIDFKRDMII